MFKHLVFIDSRVTDYPALVAGLSVDTEWFLLDQDKNGVLQMQAVLADRRDLASIRILAHGRPGALRIGSGELTCESLASHAAELAAIGTALGADGDVQIYGCEVGKGSEGRALVRALAQACGAHVAASSMPVGHADLGGVWRLDVGELRTSPIHNPRWHGLLGMTITPVAHSFERSVREFLNSSAFAALRADGSVVTWGWSNYGGNSSAVATKLDGTIDVTQVFSTATAFAALRADGSVVTWGSSFYGGDSSAVAAKVDGTIDVTQVFASFGAFAALRADGSVVTWGGNGGNSSAVATKLDGTIDVTQVFSNNDSFAALRADGSVVTWGDVSFGGNSSAVATQLDGTIDVTQVFSTQAAFAALRADGSVVTWGFSGNGGNSSAVAAKLDGTIDVTQVASTYEAFAALRADGSVVTWGTPGSGGNSSAVATKLDGTTDVTQVVSTPFAFAALRADGSVVTWGNATYGGDSSAVAAKLDGTIDVTQVVSTMSAFAALRADGSVVTWGDGPVYGNTGGDSSAVAAKLDGTIDVTQVFSTGHAFAALRADGSVVTWGNAGSGGDSSAVAAQLDGTIDVTQVFSNDYAFVALRADGSVVTWGSSSYGGNSSAVASQLHDVVGMADPYTNDVFTSTMTGRIITGTLGNDPSLTGGIADDRIYGLDGNDTLNGGAGNDTLYGGEGIDTMNGGDGSDLYVVDNAGDLVSESNADLATGGNDIVHSHLSAYTLTANVENLRLMLAGASNGTGNGLDNTLYAGSGDNVLDGAAGNDTVSYALASAGVTVSLAIAGAQATGGSGSDTLTSIENLIGSGFNDNLTGNTANNVLDGAAGSDFLNGGVGADTMLGGDGTDSYCVDHAGDLVSESNSSLATGGNDIVYSYLSAYTLTANVERLRLMLAGASNGTGNSLDNTLYAGNGNNVLDGASGTDTVSYAFTGASVTVNLASAGAQATGGSGSDTLISIENLIGSGFNDSLVGNTANNVLDGGAGSDFLNGATGADTMLGGDGTDSYCVDHAGDLVSESNSSLATGGNDIVYSYLAAYTLTTNVERLRLMLAGASNGTGNGLDNTLYAGDGNNVLDGAGGGDTVSYALASAGVIVSLVTAGSQATGGSGSDTLISIENLTGSGFNDNLTGNAVNNVLDGGAGNDTLNGGAGADTMLGGDGSDLYIIDNAGDLVTETNAAAAGGIDTVNALVDHTLSANVENLNLIAAGAVKGTGNGLDNLIYAGAGNNVIDGAGGTDTVSYALASAGVTVSLATAGVQATGGSASDTLISIENLIGSGFNDSLTGNSANNVLDGGAGSDFLNAATGADTMLGGDGTDSYCVDHAGDLVSESNSSLATGGNDIVYSYLAAYTLTANVERLRLMLAGASNGTGNALDNTLYAGDGNNVLDGVSGVDTASYQFATAAVSVSLATTAAQATGGSGSDTLQNIDNLVGSNFHDTLVGDAQANTLNGLALNDYLDGGAGNDVLLGGDGTDLLIGGLGQDLLTGGTGSDTFDFNALNETGLTNTTWDVITDFVHGTDKLDLATLDADAAFAGDQAFTAPVLGGTFSGVFASPGDLYFDTTAHVLYGNTDADTAAEFAIQLVGVSTLTAADLFL